MFKCSRCEMEFRKEDQFLYGQLQVNIATLIRYKLVKPEKILCPFCAQDINDDIHELVKEKKK